MILCCIKDSRAAPSQSPPSSKRCKEDLFWFTALTTVSSNEYWNYVKVALLSAMDKSPNLVPVLLLGEGHGPADFETVDNILWFQQHGGFVCRHNLSFGADMQDVLSK
ncbi:hypothetical protein WJX82_004961 [Trebouxia sp. C0006]